MHFLHPALLNWLWLALVPLVLWLFRRKARRVPVSTLLFFRSLAREHQESAWLRRLKRLLSLLLSLAVVVCGVLALGRPYTEGEGETPRGVVLLLDRSASMATTDSHGVSRLAQAKAMLKNRLDSLPENVVTSLVLYDDKSVVEQSRSTNRRELLRLLDQVKARPIEDAPAEGLTAARRLAALDQPAEVWHASDRPLAKGQAEMGGKVSYRFLDVALPEATNVGITGFQIRPEPLSHNRFDAFVEVSASSSNKGPVEASLEARLDGRPVQLRQMELKPGEQSRLVFALEGGQGQLLEMELRAPGDCLGWDNFVVTPLPKMKPLVVAWITQTPDPFTELALSSMLTEERIQILKGGPKDWPLKEKPDLYVFENWLPQDWPSDRPAVVLNPPGSSGPIHAKRLDVGVPYESVRAVLPEHPVLYRVTSSRVALTQTALLQVGETLETLWMAGQEPILAAGEAGGQRIVVTAFQPSKSEQLALLSAFPLLIGNAIYWCVEHNESFAALKPHRTGEVVASEHGLAQWKAWDGEWLTPVSEESHAAWLELSHEGVCETPGGKVETALLLSPRATQIPVRAATAGTSAAAKAPTLASAWAQGGNWSFRLLWAALAVLLIESWLFHRQAVY